MPEGVRYISSSLPASRRRGLSVEELGRDLDRLREESSERFRKMYVEEGASDSDVAVSGSSLTFSMIHIVLTSNANASEAYFQAQGFPEVAGSGVLFIAWEQDEFGGHRVSWLDTEFIGAASFDDEQWHVDTRPYRVTVYVFVRNPNDPISRWWLVSALSSYDSPDKPA